MKTKHSIRPMEYPTATQPEAAPPIPQVLPQRPACDPAARRRALLIRAWCDETTRQRYCRPAHGDWTREAIAHLAPFGIGNLTDDERFAIWRSLGFPPDTSVDVRRRFVDELIERHARGATQADAVQKINADLARAKLWEMSLGECQRLAARVWS